jgi:hypothetical protein
MMIYFLREEKIIHDPVLFRLTERILMGSFPFLRISKQKKIGMTVADLCQ